MVWQFNQLQDRLWDIADYLYSLQDDCRDIPVVGWAIASAVYYVYRSAWYVAYYFQRVNDWADGIVNTLDRVDDWIDWFYATIRGFDAKIAGFLSWTAIVAKLEARYKLLTDSYLKIVSQGKAAILGKYASLDTWLDAQKDKIEDLIVDRFETILDKVFVK